MEHFYRDCSEKRTQWKGSAICQPPELRLSDSSTGRVRQGERGAVVQHQGTAVLQGMCVHLETCKALVCSFRKYKIRTKAQTKIILIANRRCSEVYCRLL